MRISPPLAIDGTTITKNTDGVISASSAAAHASTHKSGGSDSIKVDEFAAPENNTNCNVTITAHGLCPKGTNESSKFLRADATWAIPDHTVISNVGTNSHTTIDSFIASKAAASGLASLNGSSKVVQDPANATATPTGSKIPISEAGGYLTVGWTRTQLRGPFRVKHGDTSPLTLYTTPAFCKILWTVTKCQENNSSRTINIGTAADTDMFVADSELPDTTATASITNEHNKLIESVTAIIATIGGSGDTGEWDFWVYLVDLT